MNIENFKIFCDLVDSQSFSKAAKLNNITQSAVSQQLRAMEKHFAVFIVDRSQKQFRLTQEGEKLNDSARDILHKYEHLKNELQEMQKIISGTIHISTVYSIGLHELPPYVKTFMKEFPAVNVRVEYRRSNLVYEDVIHNATDIGLVAYANPSRQLEIIPFHDDRLVIICSTNGPLAGKKEASVEELKDLNIVGFEKDIPTRKATDQIFKEAGYSVDPVMEFDNIETVKRAVEIDTGIAIVPQTTVKQEVSQGSLLQLTIKDKEHRRPLAIIHRKGRVLSPAMKKFIALLSEQDLIDQIEA